MADRGGSDDAGAEEAVVSITLYISIYEVFTCL